MCSIADGAAQRASISHLGRVERLVGVQREEATTSMRFDQVAHIRADWQCQRRQSVSSSGLGMYLRTIMTIVLIDDPQGQECLTRRHMGNDAPVLTKMSMYTGLRILQEPEPILSV
jgi:hypothetical protein